MLFLMISPRLQSSNWKQQQAQLTLLCTETHKSSYNWSSSPNLCRSIVLSSQWFPNAGSNKVFQIELIWNPVVFRPSFVMFICNTPNIMMTSESSLSSLVIASLTVSMFLGQFSPVASTGISSYLSKLIPVFPVPNSSLQFVQQTFNKMKHRASQSRNQTCNYQNFYVDLVFINKV